MNYLASLGLLAPYLERACLLFATPAVSSVPLMIWYLVPGKSLTRPPRIRTTLCSCKLCPSPGMYEVTSIPFERRTLAIFLRAELGFLGVAVLTAVHTPRFCGEEVLIGFFWRELKLLWRAGAVDFFTDVWRHFLTNWLNVGIIFTSCFILSSAILCTL